MTTMREARLKLNVALAAHDATVQSTLFGVCEDGHSVLVICEMADGSDVIVGFDLGNDVFVDPEDDDERRRLMAEFSRAHIVAVP
jgi:hypothetical protein